jgi:hypothetical protein
VRRGDIRGRTFGTSARARRLGRLAPRRAGHSAAARTDRKALFRTAADGAGYPTRRIRPFRPSGRSMRARWTSAGCMSPRSSVCMRRLKPGRRMMLWIPLARSRAHRRAHRDRDHDRRQHKADERAEEPEKGNLCMLRRGSGGANRHGPSFRRRRRATRASSGYRPFSGSASAEPGTTADTSVERCGFCFDDSAVSGAWKP